MTQPKTETCPVCQVKIMVGVVGGDRVLFASGPPGTRARLWSRVCKYSNKPGCINAEGASLQPTQDDYFKADAPR